MFDLLTMLESILAMIKYLVPVYEAGDSSEDDFFKEFADNGK